MVATALTTIDRIEAPDPYTLVIHTMKSDPLLRARLAFYGGQIVPKKYVESVGQRDVQCQPVGTGPVRFVSWVKDDKVALDADPDYWGGRIDVDRVDHAADSRTAPRMAALLKGEVDIITQLPPDHSDRVDARPRPGSRARCTRPLRARRQRKRRPRQSAGGAGAPLAIDREAIVKELWRGQGSFRAAHRQG